MLAFGRKEIIVLTQIVRVMSSIKFLLFAVLLVQASFVDAQNNNMSRRRGRSLNRNKVTLVQACQKIDELYETKFDVAHPSKTYDSTRVVITEYAKSLESSLVQEIQSNYYEAFYNASEKEQLDSAVNYAFKYLLVDGRKDESIMWQVLIDNYGSDGDTENTIFLIDWFKDISVLRDNAYTKMIESLTKKYDDVIHPISFDDMAKGYWISLDDKYESEKLFGIDITPRDKDGSILQKNIPDYILNIRYVTSDEGTTMLSSPRAPWNSKKRGRFWYYSPSYENYFLRTSQTTFCDADSKSLHLAFATEKINEGNTQRAQQNLASNRQWKADMHGKINSSNTSFGNQLAAGVVTDVTAGLLDALAISMGAGSKIAEGYGIELNAISPKVMNANITYRRVKESSYGYTSLKDYKPNQQNRLVKWEASDSVVFINMLGKPIFIESLSKDSPLLYEYNEVRKKYNFWKPQYLIPSAVSVGVGAACITRGITMLTHDIRENRDLPKDKQKSSTTAEVLYMTVGTTVPIVTIGIISGIISSKRQSAYNKINKKNMDKMRQKATQFSMQPILNPIDNSIGMNMSVNF